MSAPVMDGNDAVTGHIISTTIGGKNGEPKQVDMMYLYVLLPMMEVSSLELLASKSKGFAFWVKLVALGLRSAGYS